jgi:Putative Ig domain
MSIERIFPSKRTQQLFAGAIRNSFAVVAIVLVFITAKSAQSTGAVLLSYRLMNGKVGVPYSGTISANGGTSPYTFSLIDGKLPDGLTLNPASGNITGSPTIAGTKYFRLRATDKRGEAASVQAHVAVLERVSSNISIAISPTATRMASGKSQRFSATLEGTSNTAVFWSASAGSVSNSGIFTAPDVTTDTRVTVTATSAADSTRKATANVIVNPTKPTLFVTSSSLNRAQPGTPYSSFLSATGGTAPYHWSLAAGALPVGFTLSSSGQVTGTTSQTGTFAVTAAVTDATNVSASQTLVLSVSAPFATSGGGSDGPAQLPKTYFNTAMTNTPAPGTTIVVPTGGNLQAALNNATCGETIKLTAGATFKGLFTLPSKPCDNSHWIIIRTSAPDSALPAEGSRMLPCYAGVASLPGRPSFKCPSLQNVLAKVVFQSVGIGPFQLANGANHYRLIGLEITRTASNGFVGALVGAANGASAHHIILDRMWLHGTVHDDTQSAFNVNRMSYAALIDSYTTDFHCTALTGSCTDAHVVAGGTSSTPDSVNRITGNFLEASSENILYGGSGATTTPTDIEIRRNHFFKPMTWKKGQPGFVGGSSGNPFVVRNLLELKNAARVLVEGNIFENNWGGFSESGYAILLTPKNQAGANGTNLCPICAVTDVTIRYSKISHSGAGISIANLPSDNGGIARLGERYSIHDVTIDDIQAGLYVGNGILFEVYNNWPNNPLNQITIDHVTGFPDPRHNFLSLGNLLSNPQMFGFKFTNSIVGQVLYPVWSVGGLSDCAKYDVPLTSLNSCFASWSFSDNAIIATSYPPSKWPVGNYFPISASAVQFTNFNGGNLGNYTLLSSSPYHNLGSDGKDLGADIKAITSATAGVY